jgi:endoglucanase
VETRCNAACIRIAVMLALLLASCGRAADPEDQRAVPIASAGPAAVDSGSQARQVKSNQLGFLPGSAKWAVVPAVAAAEFELIDVRSAAVVHTGTLGATAMWVPARESVKLAEFSAFSIPGHYTVRVRGAADSHPFRISHDVYTALAAASIKAFYYNRAGIQLPASHAGAYARPAGHADTEVLVHASAASAMRPAGTVISSPKGWYDAGDYNKYIVNSGIATYTLLAAYEHFPDRFTQQDLDIPESGDAIPDLLDEALWNLEWMLTMQDPNDGGVYHKLTNKEFDGMVMPHEATAARYVVQKSTAAALDFAAVMATASRVFIAYETQRPGLSARMRSAAESAWRWALAHPDVVYVQPADIRTGGYNDGQLADELAWAAAELYITTGEDSYYAAMRATNTDNIVPSWSQVSGLAWLSLAHHRDALTGAADQTLIRARVVGLANTLRDSWQASAYRVGMDAEDFVWGSNAVALNKAIVLLAAYRLEKERGHLDAAQAMFDYVLGRNATDVAQVTGFGSRSTLHPHHRPSIADTVVAPVPGFLAGGANPGQQDKGDCPVAYSYSIAARSYLDHQCSYASNEVAINWNAPLVYVAAGLQALTPR